MSTVKKYGKRLFHSTPTINKGKIVYLGALNPTVKKELSAQTNEDVIDVLDSYSGGLQ